MRIILLCFLFVLFSCTILDENKENRLYSVPLRLDKVSLTFIDGCEYLVFQHTIIHKANCKNPIHEWNKK